MELEFDKEIDAILRKGRGGVAAASAAVATSHLDADAIAAFAENALPENAKLLYLKHFADCDACRRQLSQTIMMNTEADAAAASAVSAPIAEVTIPWYRNLFKTQNLALAMGALVVAFSSFLGYLVLQSGNGSRNAEVSQVTQSQQQKGGPFVGSEDGMANATAANANSAPASVMTSANTAAAVSNTAANAAANSSVTTPNTGTGTGGRLETLEEKKALSDDKVYSLDGNTEVFAKKPAAGSPTRPADEPKKERDKNDSTADEISGARKDVEFAKRKQNEDRKMSREASPPAAAKVGPSRSGPVQSQTNQINSNVFDMAVTRLVGNKTFDNRNGAWYDSAYHGQATTNVNRGTDTYKKLDGGLRKIADTLGGTVVVVWKEKAYRIQ